MKNYRTPFLLALAGNVLLVAALAVFWWSSHHAEMAQSGLSGAKQQAITVMKKLGIDIMPASGQPEEMPPQANGPAPSVAPGETPLVPVQISPQRLESIGVKHGRVVRRTVDDEIRTAGNVAVDETHLAYVQVRFSGFIEKVFADATYQHVTKGQALFTIYSPDLAATEREYVVARQNQKQVARSSVPGVASGAASLLEAAVDRLKQWQVPDSEIARLESTGEVRQELEIDSPVSGYITERHAFPSTAVQPDTRLYAIADLSTVWVNAEVFQSDLARVKVDAPAAITLDTYPGRVLSGAWISSIPTWT